MATTSSAWEWCSIDWNLATTVKMTTTWSAWEWCSIDRNLATMVKMTTNLEWMVYLTHILLLCIDNFNGFDNLTSFTSL